MADPTLGVVFVAALITAVATGIGALPLLVARRVSRRWLGLANAVAAGLMLAACHALIVEGFGFNPLRTVAGIVLGLVFIVAAGQVLRRHDRLEIAEVKDADARRIVLIIGIMTLHSAAEGIGVGVAYGGDEALGRFITAAIALHNIPEGLAIALVMVPRGASVANAAGWSIVSSLPQPLLAVPAFVLVAAFVPLLPLGLGIAAGAMIWMVFAELMPEANERVSPAMVGIAVTLAFAAMLSLQMLFAG